MKEKNKMEKKKRKNKSFYQHIRLKLNIYVCVIDFRVECNAFYI